ncbi:MAG: CoA-binding protein, partial [Desulfobacteraceae bacterium]|nr:CoA-binding protein [Desulfobacteraceae bacterium]
KANFPFVGPNCLGIYAPEVVDTFFLPGERIIRPKKGNVGFVSQSGGVLVDQMVKFAGQGIGISLGVSIGNKACLREIDMIDWFENDLGTRVIAFYIEGFEYREGREFIQRAQTCTKPIVVLKAGKSPKGIAAVSSHTASLAGDYRVFSEVMKQYCVAEAEDEYELTSFCEALSCYPKGSRGNVGIVTLSGGHGVVAADACSVQGVNIPGITSQTIGNIREKLSREVKEIASLTNPMDLTGSCVDSDIEASVRHLARDENIDCILTLLLPYSPGISTDIGAKLSQVARNEGKPLIAYVPNEDKYKIIIEGFELNNIPVASSVEGAVLMAKALKRSRPC